MWHAPVVKSTAAKKGHSYEYMTQLRMNSSKTNKQTNKQNKTWKGRKGHHKT
jgi:hypothetical protein